MSIYYEGFNPVAFGLLKSLPLVVMALLIFNLIQKKFIPQWGRKRLATFYLAIGVFILLAFAFVIFRYRLSDLWLLPVVLLLGVLGWLKRGNVFPFVRHCRQCGQALSFREIFLNPADICKSCREAQPEEE